MATAEGYSYLTEGEVQRLDELAERLQVEGLRRAIGNEAVDGMFVQDALLEVED